MKVLTFDIEEWFIEKAFHGGRAFMYQEYDNMLTKVLDELDMLNVKGTFFCVGGMALDFPDVVRRIAARGHEIGCHSYKHLWVNKMTEETFYEDTKEALKALEDVVGQKVKSYRAPAFSITEKNPWAISVLAHCGIENDSSIFPAHRDFGGYPSFFQDKPCKVEYHGATLKEYPIGMMSVAGRKVAYSGGGYFKLIPYWVTSWMMRQHQYDICYFHLYDLISEKRKLMSRADYEKLFRQPGTIKNRLIRYLKSNARTGDTFEKLRSVLHDFDFVNIRDSQNLIRWDKVERIEL